MMKAQFMSLWDGLDTSATTQVKTITLHHLFTAVRVRSIMLHKIIKKKKMSGNEFGCASVCEHGSEEKEV